MAILVAIALIVGELIRKKIPMLKERLWQPRKKKGFDDVLRSLNIPEEWEK